MKDNNSQEYQNCYNFEFMDLTAQKSVAAETYDQAMKDEQTCIGYRRGMAHKLSDTREVKPGL